MPSAGLPTAEQRLLVAFRYWNYIEYFFISRDLTDVPWPQTLKRIALQLDTAGSELSYQLSILELISAIDDSHAGSAMKPNSRAGPVPAKPVRSWPTPPKASGW